MVRLWDRMADFVDDPGDRAEAFGYTLQSGVWTHHNNGDTCDSRRASARTGEAQLFCATFGLPKTATFAIKKFGEEACLMLCKAWFHSKCFLFDLWFAAGMDPSYAFVKHQVSEYIVPGEVRAFSEAALAVFRERLHEIQLLKPRRLMSKS